MDVCVVLYGCGPERVEPGLRDHDSLLVVDNTHRNTGFAAGANEAARLGSQPLICFVNPDGDLTRDCLDALEAGMADPTVAACEPDLGGGNREWAPGGTVEWLSGSCLVVRRELFEQVGGFDERLFMYAEDVDLSYKLAAHGRLVHVADSVYEHRGGRRGFRANHRNARNWLVVQRRHRTADPGRMARDGLHALRTGELILGVARVTGTLDYLARGRRWAGPPSRETKRPSMSE
jgi:GT2 family glycosyltransferase